MVIIDPTTGLATLPSDNLRWVIEPWSKGYPESNVLRLQKRHKSQSRVVIPVSLSFWEKVCGKPDQRYELQDDERWVTLYFRPFKEATPSCRGPVYEDESLWSRNIGRRPDLKITKELVQEFSIEIMSRYSLDLEIQAKTIALKENNNSYRGEYPPKSLTDVVEDGTV